MLRSLLFVSFLFVVVTHVVLMFFMAAAFFVIPFYQPWYVALPLEVFIVRLVFSRSLCPLTELENTIRQKLGYKRIGGFVGNYFVRPIKKLMYGKRTVNV